MQVKVILVIIGVIVFLGVGVWVGYKWATPSGTEPKSHDELIDQILQISELGTIAMHAAVVEKRTPKPASWRYEPYDVILVWQGWVKAGINLDSASIRIESKKNENQDVSEIKTVIVTLPATKILGTTYDPQGFQYYIIWTGAGVGKAPPSETISGWSNEGTEKLNTNARNHGITAQAEERAKEIIKTYIRTLGYKVDFEQTTS